MPATGDRLAKIAPQCLQSSQDEGFILWERVAAIELAIATGQRDPSANMVPEIDLERDRFFATQTVLTDLLITPALAESIIKGGSPGDALARLDKAVEDANRRMEKLNLAEIYRMRDRHDWHWAI